MSIQKFNNNDRVAFTQNDKQLIGVVHGVQYKEEDNNRTDFKYLIAVEKDFNDWHKINSANAKNTIQQSLPSFDQYTIPEEDLKKA